LSGSRSYKTRPQSYSTNKLSGGKADYDNFTWRELPKPQRLAATRLGYTRKGWDNDAKDPPIFKKPWKQLMVSEKQAAMVLGYNQLKWDGPLNVNSGMNVPKQYASTSARAPQQYIKRLPRATSPPTEEDTSEGTSEGTSEDTSEGTSEDPNAPSITKKKVIRPIQVAESEDDESSSSEDATTAYRPGVTKVNVVPRQPTKKRIRGTEAPTEEGTSEETSESGSGSDDEDDDEDATDPPRRVVSKTRINPNSMRGNY